MKEVKIPAKFYWDHTYRDLPETGRSELVKQTKSYVVVRLDEDAERDLLTDAAYYADGSTNAGMPGLASSARATLKALG